MEIVLHFVIILYRWQEKGMTSKVYGKIIMGDIREMMQELLSVGKKILSKKERELKM